MVAVLIIHRFMPPPSGGQPLDWFDGGDKKREGLFAADEVPSSPGRALDAAALEIEDLHVITDVDDVDIIESQGSKKRLRVVVPPRPESPSRPFITIVMFVDEVGVHHVEDE